MTLILRLAQLALVVVMAACVAWFVQSVQGEEEELHECGCDTVWVEYSELIRYVYPEDLQPNGEWTLDTLTFCHGGNW